MSASSLLGARCWIWLPGVACALLSQPLEAQAARWRLALSHSPLGNPVACPKALLLVFSVQHRDYLALMEKKET